MTISIFDLFKIGIGPSSSHTVGPMVAARRFANHLLDEDKLANTSRVKISLYGSLGATGKGHGSDKAILLGMMGQQPETVIVDKIPEQLDSIRSFQILKLAGQKNIDFNEATDLIFHRKKSLPFHANGMMFCAYDSQGNE
ncbi:MAG: serine dehydratase beta chain, partial [Cocleimonas sp.]